MPTPGSSCYSFTSSPEPVLAFLHLTAEENSESITLGVVRWTRRCSSAAVAGHSPSGYPDGVWAKATHKPPADCCKPHIFMACSSGLHQTSENLAKMVPIGQGMEQSEPAPICLSGQLACEWPGSLAEYFGMLREQASRYPKLHS